MELEPRTTAPAHATGAVDFVPLADVDADATFRLREEGDVADLASSIGRLGQLVPIELRPLPGLGPEDPPRWQVVAGFRRLAALKLLARERVLARVHGTLDDDDAWGIALAHALLATPLGVAELEALRARLAGLRTAAWAEEHVEDAIERATVAAAVSEAEPAPDAEPEPEPEPQVEPEDAGPVEVTADELAEDLAARLNEVNQDLALAFESWGDLPAEGRRAILEQAEYVAALLPHLRREGR
ncbi:MAG TPA: ParB N-terminal domain-containing protein [Anaeromyxobacter sp.]